MSRLAILWAIGLASLLALSCSEDDGDAATCPEQADCSGRQCGADPVCGTSCGECASGESCSAQGQCEAQCQPDCTERVCGADPVCGASCGECGSGESCNAQGQCEAQCQPDCSGRVCGADPVCGASCGECESDESCSAQGQCEAFAPVSPCDPDVTDRYAAWLAEPITAAEYQLSTFETVPGSMEAGSRRLDFSGSALSLTDTGDSSPVVSCQITNASGTCRIVCDNAMDAIEAETDSCHFTGAYLTETRLAFSVSFGWLGGVLEVLDASTGEEVWYENLYGPAEYLQIKGDCLEMWHPDTNIASNPDAAFWLFRASDGLPRLEYHTVAQTQFRSDLLSKVSE